MFMINIIEYRSKTINFVFMEKNYGVDYQLRHR